jgi:hypothetical protein
MRAPGPDPRRNRRPLLRGDHRRSAGARLYLPARLDNAVNMTSAIADRDSAQPEKNGAPVRAARQSASADVRLAWAPRRDGNPPAGAWWPRSRDAAAELRSLLPLASHHLGGAVTRVSLNIDTWDADQPRRLRVGDCLVRLGWFHTLDAGTVVLRRGSDPGVTLHVVAPEADPAAAHKLLQELSNGSP